MPKIIYTTGITGFIGQHFLKKLINKYDITVNFGRNKKISIYQSSLNPIYKDFNLNELEAYQADSIFHLATYYNPNPKDLSEEDLLEESNFNFPFTLCNDLKKLGLKKIISTSSYMQLLDSEHQNLYSETKNKFINISSKNLLQFLDDYEDKKIKEVPQPRTGSTYANKIDNSFKHLNWASETAGEIEKRIRSLNPKHGAFTYLGEERVKIFSSSIVKDSGFLEPGQINVSIKGSFKVGCKNNSHLKIETLQMPGKKIISSKEFVRGYKSNLETNLKFS